MVLKNVSSENLGKNKEIPAVGKPQRSLWEHIACTKYFSRPHTFRQPRGVDCILNRGGLAVV